MAETTEVTTRELDETQLPSVRASFTDVQGFALAQRVAKALAASTLVPAQYQNNMPNCLIALEMAERLHASILMIMQNLYVVQGRPGWSSKFLIASFNQCGRFSSIRYEWVGEPGNDGWGCRAWATELRGGARIVGPLITIALAKKEGWYGKNGSKWQTIPELMLMYRSAGWLVNTHAPEISMGLGTSEEAEDIELTPDAGGTYEATASAQTAAATAERQTALREKYAAKPANSPGAHAQTDEQQNLIERINHVFDELAEMIDADDAGKALALATGDRPLSALTADELRGVEQYMAGVLKQAQSPPPEPDCGCPDAPAGRHVASCAQYVQPTPKRAHRIDERASKTTASKTQGDLEI